MSFVSRTPLVVLLALGSPLACGEDGGDADTTAADTHADHGEEEDTTAAASSEDDAAETSSGAAESSGTSAGGPTSTSGADESTSTGAPVVDTWENWALPDYFEPYCIGCHPGQSTRDFNMYEVVVENIVHIRCGTAPEALPDCDDHIEPGHLPIGDGPYPSDDERWRLVDWIDAGTPRDP